MAGSHLSTFLTRDSQEGRGFRAGGGRSSRVRGRGISSFLVLQGSWRSRAVESHHARGPLGDLAELTCRDLLPRDTPPFRMDSAMRKLAARRDSGTVIGIAWAAVCAFRSASPVATHATTHCDGQAVGSNERDTHGRVGPSPGRVPPRNRPYRSCEGRLPEEVRPDTVGGTAANHPPGPMLLGPHWRTDILGL